MNPELKQKWTEALRSGRYQQTNGYLRDSCGYCCLGVLCDIVDPNGWSLDEWAEENRHRIADDNELGATGCLTVGLEDDAETHVIEMNDGGTPFTEIADWIDANVAAE